MCYSCKVNLLHTENFKHIPLNGRRIERGLQERALFIAKQTKALKDPDVSILIRSRNDATYLQQLLDDIQTQEYDGKIELILVDTESHDDTIRLAISRGAKITHLTQKDFTYPKALNLGFQAASHPWVVTLVGHSNLSNRLFLKSLTYWSSQKDNLGGIYGLPLANWNASRWEHLENSIAPTIWKKAAIQKKLSIGILGANSSIVSRDAWEKLGGYDERFAAGGEDRAFAQTLLDNDFSVVREPLCSVFHSHGLSAANSLRQWIHWVTVAKKALPFETDKVHKRRPDLR